MVFFMCVVPVVICVVLVARTQDVGRHAVEQIFR